VSLERFVRREPAIPDRKRRRSRNRRRCLRPEVSARLCSAEDEVGHVDVRGLKVLDADASHEEVYNRIGTVLARDDIAERGDVRCGKADPILAIGENRDGVIPMACGRSPGGTRMSMCSTAAAGSGSLARPTSFRMRRLRRHRRSVVVTPLRTDPLPRPRRAVSIRQGPYLQIGSPAWPVRSRVAPVAVPAALATSVSQLPPMLSR